MHELTSKDKLGKCYGERVVSLPGRHSLGYVCAEGVAVCMYIWGAQAGVTCAHACVVRGCVRGDGGGGWFVKVFLCGGRAGVSKHACWHVLGGSYLCLLFNTMLDFVDLAWDGIQVSSLLFLLI